MLRILKRHLWTERMRFLRILPNMALRRFWWCKKCIENCEIYLDVENTKEAFEDGMNEVFEDTTTHGIVKIWVG